MFYKPSEFVLSPFHTYYDLKCSHQLSVVCDASFCRFQVDFIKGSDVVFHLNPRFHEQTIVRNSCLGGRWGPEERDGVFPFAPGRRFEVDFIKRNCKYVKREIGRFVVKVLRNQKMPCTRMRHQRISRFFCLYVFYN